MMRPFGTMLLVGLGFFAVMVHFSRVNQEIFKYTSYYYTQTTSSNSNVVSRPVVQQQKSSSEKTPPSLAVCDNSTTIMTAPLKAPDWLKIPGSDARWLHIGKAGGGTFLGRLRERWRINMMECHPRPCGGVDANRLTAILIRDPVDRFVSAFYWRAAMLCYRAGYICDPQRYSPPRNPKLVGKYDSPKEVEIRILFNHSRGGEEAGQTTNVNVFAERFCDEDGGDHDVDLSRSTTLENSTMALTTYEQAALDIRKIGHLKDTVVDWLEQSNVMTGPPQMLVPVVLERGFDFTSQIDEFVQHVVVDHTQQENMTTFGVRQDFVHYKDCVEDGNNINNASPKSKWEPLSEKNIRCVARFFRKDYEVIHDLAKTHCKTETCRMAIQSIWNRRAHLLS